jgi:DtxR family Mn-dependent transcriptional regulator
LGHKTNEAFRHGVVSVTELVGETEAKTYTLTRIGEPLQVFSEQLADMRTAGLVPGAKVSLDFEQDGVRVTESVSGAAMIFSRDLAAHLFVAA